MNTRLSDHPTTSVSIIRFSSVSWSMIGEAKKGQKRKKAELLYPTFLIYSLSPSLDKHLIILFLHELHILVTSCLFNQAGMLTSLFIIVDPNKEDIPSIRFQFCGIFLFFYLCSCAASQQIARENHTNNRSKLSASWLHKISQIAGVG